MKTDLHKLKSGYKIAKKAYKRARRKNVSGWKFLGIFTTVLSLVLAGVTAFLNMFDNTIAAFVGGSFHEHLGAHENAR